jgi:ABC-type phosphate transport system substrate-binding protein
MYFFRHLGLLNLLVFNILFANDKIAIVVAQNSPIQTITKCEIKNIFLSKTKQFANGDRTYAVELYKSDSSKLFYSYISDKSPKQLRSYWSRLIFTGKGRPPKKFNDLQQLTTFLVQTPNAIGYLPLASVDQELLKVLLVLP